ncbi:hypothetical protein M9H77_17801 [Catharanthus roseus]|uniref:Uncharacterized protein n=1 Tax=Catharanthus roseus TaxID=4058 RepID=A0ACC0B5P3_CATRO|nr:hypothetical protein M9H77_17801 [Catharanthus roseus]
MGLRPIKTSSLMKKALRRKCGVKNHEGLGQGQAKVKLMESSMGDKREEMRESCCDISSPLHSLSTEETQPQFFNVLTTTYGTKPNHRMKAKDEGMEKELSVGYEDTSIILYLKPSFKEGLVDQYIRIF